MRKPLRIQKCDRPTDGRTDLPTDTARCRVACPRLKSGRGAEDKIVLKWLSEENGSGAEGKLLLVELVDIRSSKHSGRVVEGTLVVEGSRR